jgi:hypothetical protein
VYLCAAPINFGVSEPVLMELGMNVILPEPILMAFLMNPSCQALCLYVYPSRFARRRYGKDVTAATNTHTYRIIFQLVVLYAVRAVSKEKVRLINLLLCCM